MKLNTDMISSSASPDSLRNKLEEIFKLMLVVWAKESIALKTISGQKSGTFRLFIYIFSENKYLNLVLQIENKFGSMANIIKEKETVVVIVVKWTNIF